MSKPDEHVKPFVFESRGAKALHFSIHEIQSRMQVDDPHGLDLEYTRTMMGFLLFVPDPRSIAMVGLGGGSLPKFCHRHLPQARISVVEINPHVIALREAFDIPPDGERFQVLLGDGSRYVRQPGLALDVLIVDGYTSDGMPTALASQRFYDDCAAALDDGGVLVVNLHQRDTRYARLLERMRRAFDDAVLAVADRDGCNAIIFASKGEGFGNYRPGIARHPMDLDAQAADQLLKAFGPIVAALGDDDPARSN